MNKSVLKEFYSDVIKNPLFQNRETVSLRDLLLEDKEIVSKTIKHIAGSSYALMHANAINGIQEGFHEWVLNTNEDELFRQIRFPTCIDHNSVIDVTNPILDLIHASLDEICLVYHVSVIFLMEYYIQHFADKKWQTERIIGEVSRYLTNSLYFYINLCADHATYIGDFLVEESHLIVLVVMIKFYRNLDKEYVVGILEYLTYLYLENEGEFSDEVIEDLDSYIKRNFKNVDLNKVFQLNAILCLVNVFDIVEYFLELFVNSEGFDIFPKEGYSPSELQTTISNWSMV